MALEEQIMAAMKEAMKNKDEATLRGIRAIKSAILLAKTEPGASKELDAGQELKILQKLVKSRKDSLDIFLQQHREDLAQKEREEIAVIEKYLPEQMSNDELRSALEKIISNVGAQTPQDMGKVMATASKELAGKADGRTISNLVKELLAKP